MHAYVVLIIVLEIEVMILTSLLGVHVTMEFSFAKVQGTPFLLSFLSKFYLSRLGGQQENTQI